MERVLPIGFEVHVLRPLRPLHGNHHCRTSFPSLSFLTDTTQVTWGPLSFLTAFLITTDSPYRHPIQALVSTGQFYGDALYYLTSLFDDFYSGKTFYRPELYYFWFYFVFMNAFWLVIPACKYSDVAL
jgi:cholestenol delta-isomerase